MAAALFRTRCDKQNCNLRILHLKHRGGGTHICVSKLTTTAPSHCLNQSRNLVNWTFRNKLQWNLNRNPYIFIPENAFENVVCKTATILSRPQCVKTFTSCCSISQALVTPSCFATPYSFWTWSYIELPSEDFNCQRKPQIRHIAYTLKTGVKWTPLSTPLNNILSILDTFINAWCVDKGVKCL